MMAVSLSAAVSPASPIEAFSYSYLSLLLLPSLLVCLLLPLVFLRGTSRFSLLRRPNQPPGPRAFPLIGHLHLLGSNPHRSLSLLSQTYGPLMSLRFGSMPVLVASSPAMARQILQVHDQAFSFRLQTAVLAQLCGCADILSSQPGPYLKLMRQICVTDLFGSKRLQSFRPLIAEEVRLLLRAVLDMAAEVPVRAILYTATNDMISRMAMGKRLADLGLRSQADPSSDSIVTLVVNAIYLMGALDVGDFIPALAWMDLQGYVHRSKAVAAKLNPVWQGVIDGRREERRRSNSTSKGEGEQLDFLDVLMMASESDGVAITDLHIRAMLLDMFAGGTDTASITVEWALAELLSNPIKMEKVQRELEQVVGMSRLVEESDIPHLPYLRAVVKETMRIHPVVPMLAPHKAGQDCQVCGYDIPRDTIAIVNVWAIGRDPSNWERPLEFSPERFLECDTDVHGQHFELLPFGSGRRACPGRALGLATVQFVLASLLHSFEWSVAEKPDMTEKFGLVTKMEKPLVARATPRVANDILFK